MRHFYVLDLFKFKRMENWVDFSKKNYAFKEKL